MNIFSKLIITQVILSSAFIFSGCNYIKYNNGIKNETAKTFDRNKDYVYGLSFEGLIIDKIFCNKCNLNKYSLTLVLTQLKEKPGIMNVEYPPYFSFKGDSILNIIVSKELFEKVKVNDKLFKVKESPNLMAGGQALLFLSSDKSKWLP